MNPPNKHHYIPAFYLRRWAGSDNLICQWNRPFDTAVKPRRVHPNGTGYSERLYELRGFEPELAQQIELNFFRPVDSLAASVLDEAENNGGKVLWNPEKRSAWTRFIITLLLRSPEDLQTFRTNWDRDFYTVDALTQNQYEQIRSASDPALFSDFLLSRSQVQKERMMFQVFLSLFNVESIGQYINNMLWQFLTYGDAEVEFFTSDRPVIRTKGIKAPDGHIVLPVGPQSLFIASASKEIHRTITQMRPKVIMAECNRQVVGSAVKLAYSINDKCNRFMQNRFGTTPQSRIVTNLGLSKN